MHMHVEHAWYQPKAVQINNSSGIRHRDLGGAAYGDYFFARNQNNGIRNRALALQINQGRADDGNR